MGSHCFDIETFPNFFSVTFVNLVDKEDIHQFTICSFKDQRKEIIKFLETCDTLVGFNNLSYDEPLLLLLQKTIKSNRLNDILFNCSNRLIAEGNWQDEAIRKLRWQERSWKSIDLLKIMAFDKRGISLKQAAISLGWPVIQDLPFDYDYEIQKRDIAIVLEYNLNDTLITLELYNKIEPERKLRDEINQIYGVNVTNASDSKIANILLEKFYLQRNNIDRRDLIEQRTYHQNILIGNCIPKDIVFQTEPMQRFLEELKEVKVKVDNKFSYKKEIYLNSNIYQLGIGGLHSEDKPGRFISDEDYILIDADVSSYYPSIMLNHRIKPAHLNDNFLDILDTIRQERLEAKHLGHKTKADALKITINSIFGKLGSPTFWLQDAKAMLSVTISGQLYLLMLIEQLGLADIQVISANTDGILCRVHKDQQERFNNICENWMEYSNFEMEFTLYKQYIRTDVNNYLVEKMDGKLKQKGLYLTEIDIKKAYKHPIIPIAICNYFIKGIPVEETIQSSQNILEFCISQKVGNQYATEYHTKNGVEQLQKNNRFFISNKGGALLKRNLKGGRNIALYSGKYVTILNRLPIISQMEKWGINYKFYIDECYKVIDEIVKPYTQLSFI